MEKKEQNGRRRTAVALEYQPDEAAPKIVASGHGMVAERILETARTAAVPVHEDAKLAKTLAKLEVGEYIPQELYGVVAEVLVYVDRMDHIRSKVMKDRRS